MANTYKALSTVTVGAGGAASVSFTNIPQTYTDLIIKSSVRVAFATVDGIVIQFNSDTNAANYSQRRLYGNGASAASDTSLTVSAMIGVATGSGYTASTFSNGEVYIPNYAGSAKKSFSTDAVTENNSTTSFNFLIAGLWNNTAAITDIVIKDEAGSTFDQNSTFTLYGVFNADVSSAPATPTIGTASIASATSANVAFTSVSNAASYTATSTPDSITATGTSSPIVVTGLTTNTAYTFTVKSNNPFGSSANSAASNSITPTDLAYDSIGTVTVGAGGASFADFTSIPSTYKNLELRLYGMGSGSSANVNIRMRLNSDSGSNYNNHNFFGVGGAGTSGQEQQAQTSSWIGQMANGEGSYFSPAVITLFNYANTATFKTMTSLAGESTNSAGSGQEYLGFFSSSWANTNAINAIRIYPESGNFAQYTKIALYGIRG